MRGRHPSSFNSLDASPSGSYAQLDCPQRSPLNANKLPIVRSITFSIWIGSAECMAGTHAFVATLVLYLLAAMLGSTFQI
jgi:hypothetical protein